MINRYANKTIYTNKDELYQEFFNERNVNFINHYGTPVFQYPNNLEVKNINIDYHVWTTGDRFYKLSYKYYGSASDWWVIAKFNLKPTESHVKLGDIIKIPLSIAEALRYMKG